MKTIIVDDERKARVLLQSILQEELPYVSVIDLCEDLPSAVKSIKKNKPDVVLLDIEMPGFSGLQLLDFFNEEEIDFAIIFITAYNNFAIQAFKLSALDYLLKPIHVDQLSGAFDRLRKQKNKHAELLACLKNNLQSQLDKRIAIPNRDSISYIQAVDILYIKADGSYSVFHSKNKEKFTLSRNLKFVEQMVEGLPFLKRCHKSYIVNVKEIKTNYHAQGTVSLSDGSIIQVSEDRAEELL